MGSPSEFLKDFPAISRPKPITFTINVLFILYFLFFYRCPYTTFLIFLSTILNILSSFLLRGRLSVAHVSIGITSVEYTVQFVYLPKRSAVPSLK
jgi:hypothetical protein